MDGVISDVCAATTLGREIAVAYKRRRGDIDELCSDVFNEHAPVVYKNSKCRRTEIVSAPGTQLVDPARSAK